MESHELRVGEWFTLNMQDHEGRYGYGIWECLRGIPERDYSSKGLILAKLVHEGHGKCQRGKTYIIPRRAPILRFDDFKAVPLHPDAQEPILDGYFVDLRDRSPVAWEPGTKCSHPEWFLRNDGLWPLSKFCLLCGKVVM